MPLYRYVKEVPKSHKLHAQHGQRKSRRFPLTAGILMGMGIIIICWVLWPILSFELFVAAKLNLIIRPIPDEVVASAFENQLGNLLGTSSIDYTKARNWFPKLPQKNQGREREVVYTLSIPKLRISHAHVVIGGEDLDKSLIHYGGSALPGDYGNTVVFGHSTLPVFFNPENYLTIFSTLPTLKEGDTIIIDSDATTYKYIVYDMKVVTPDDVSVLQQAYDWSYLSIVTCVPPGTYWKRLVVRARLEKI